MLVEIYVTSGAGEGTTPLAAFDQALTRAGIANCNLMYLSSVIPPGVCLRQGQPPLLGGWGDRLYVVIAQQREVVTGTEAWAGIGWVQELGSGRGLFVEHHGNSQHQVEAQIHETMQSMLAYRDGDWGDIDFVTVGITCEKNPVCAVAAAVYQAEPWLSLPA